MNQFFRTLPGNIISCFKGRMIIWHIVAIALTFILVTSGFDWFYFRSTRNPNLRHWMFYAVIIGQLIPMTLPLLLLLIGIVAKKAAVYRTGWAIGQAALIGWSIASAYKALTGRAHPPHSLDTDTSHLFHFGFLRGGIFWGWPSSHTTTAFAMAVTVFTLFPQKRWLGILTIIYASYIGIGVSMTIHWFSDFVAGAIIGSVIGATVGKSFLRGKQEWKALPKLFFFTLNKLCQRHEVKIFNFIFSQTKNILLRIFPLAFNPEKRI